MALVAAEGTCCPGCPRPSTLCRRHGLPLAVASSSRVPADRAGAEPLRAASATFRWCTRPRTSPTASRTRRSSSPRRRAWGWPPHRCLVWEDAPAGRAGGQGGPHGLRGRARAAERDHPAFAIADAVLGSLGRSTRRCGRWPPAPTRARAGPGPSLRSPPAVRRAGRRRTRPGRGRPGAPPRSRRRATATADPIRPTTQETPVFRPVPPDADFVDAGAGGAGPLARAPRLRAVGRPSGDGAEPWVFYEGPPTANGRPGLHHVWARVYKDLFCRYRTMRGYRWPAGPAGTPTACRSRWRWRSGSASPASARSKTRSASPSSPACAGSRSSPTSTTGSELTERIGYWVDLDAAYWTLRARPTSSRSGGT